jgi:glycosyltransferase involved in cell wall biosynthesis
MFDVGCGAWVLAARARRGVARLVHARGSIPGAMARPAAKVAGAKFLYDADGPLSEEYVEAGVWPAGSPGHRLARASERKCFEAADRVAVLSGIYADEKGGELGRRPEVLPCAVDTGHYRPQPEARARIRAELGLEGTVFVYAGKAGGWYRTEEMFDFVAAFQAGTPPVIVLVLTTQEPAAFEASARARGLRCVVRRATRADMPGYLSSADAALSFRSPTPSQRAASPIKNGEYLACGLPVVSTGVAGDYPALLRRERVGVVVEGLDRAAYDRAAAELQVLLADHSRAGRCREVAVREVDLEQVVLPRYERLYRELLGEPRP